MILQMLVGGSGNLKGVLEGRALVVPSANSLYKSLGGFGNFL